MSQVHSALLYDIWHTITHIPDSAITWSGFDNFYYLFTYEDTRDAFSIPYDIEITQEVFQNPTVGGEASGERASRSLYNRKNKFFEAMSITALVEAIEDEADRFIFAARIAVIKKQYAALSDDYQKQKGTAGAIAFK